MKRYLLASLLLVVVGCAHDQGAVEHEQGGRRVRDITLRSAVFGTGVVQADVTERVAKLLESEPQGFKAHGDWLRVDPVPGKSKAMVIRYTYRGHERTYIVTGDQRVSYNLLTAAAG